MLGIVLAAVAATFAIAFGLGGREVARALNAGRFVRASFAVGETISVGDLRGQIVGIETDATVIRTADGRVRVPNNMLVESVVTIHGELPRIADGQRPGAAPALRGARRPGAGLRLLVDAARMTRPRRPRGRVLPRMAPPSGLRSPARPASAAPR